MTYLGEHFKAVKKPETSECFFLIPSKHLIPKEEVIAIFGGTESYRLMFRRKN